MKRAAALAVLAVLAVGAVIVVRTARLRRLREPTAAPAAIAFDISAAADRLAGAIRFKTVSTDDPSARDAAAFDGLDAYLADAFPDVSRVLTRERVGRDSLLYTWMGARPDEPPVLLLAHLDVVPADDPVPAAAATGTATTRWTHPPFSGAIADGSVWGRGTLDDKGAALGLLEAVSALVRSGFAPERTIYLAFGDDEEVDETPSGAAAIAALLASRGVRNAWLLDEGGFIIDHAAGASRPAALVGIAEKRAISLVLRVDAAGGHASMPPRETAVGILARAIDRLERDPMPARLTGPARQTFDALAPYLPWPRRVLFANLWLTRPLVLRALAASPETDALIRTTLAPTVIEGSAKSNVLPITARAVVNVRLAPGDTPDDVLQHATRAIDDGRVVVSVDARAESQARVSPASGPAFDTLAASIRAIYPDAIVVPFLTTGATDARRYRDVAPYAYRLVPVQQDGAVDELHGVDEHLTLAAYAREIRTYATVIEEWTRAR